MLDSHHASVANGSRRIQRAADAATQDPSPGVALTADAPNVGLDLYSRFVVAWRGGQAGEHARLANRALERLMRAVPQAGAHHG